MIGARETTAVTAVLDWGIGGLSVYKEIKRRAPERRIAYLSDSGAVPYGKQSSSELAARLIEVIRELAVAELSCREVVIACNAASTVAAEVRAALPGLRIIDVISNGVRQVQATPYTRVGVIGGRRTIESGVYERALQTSDREIIGRVAQPLSALIERGELRSAEMTATLQEILEPLVGVHALLLACTHYPAVRDQIQAMLPGTVLLDPAAATAQELLATDRHGESDAGADLFFTTGDRAQTELSARLAFGLELGTVGAWGGPVVRRSIPTSQMAPAF